METSSRQLRVAVFSLDDEPTLIVPSFIKERNVELFRTDSQIHLGPSRKLAAKALLEGLPYNINTVRALSSLDTVEGEDGTAYDGYAVHVTERVHQRGRNFNVREFGLPIIENYLSQNPALLDPIDRAFIAQSLRLPLVEASLERTAVGLDPLENQR